MHASLASSNPRDSVFLEPSLPSLNSSTASARGGTASSSRPGTGLGIGTGDGSVVVDIADMPTSPPPPMRTGHAGAIMCGALDKSRGLLVSGSKDCFVKCWVAEVRRRVCMCVRVRLCLCCACVALCCVVLCCVVLCCVVLCCVVLCCVVLCCVVLCCVVLCCVVLCCVVLCLRMCKCRIMVLSGPE